MITLVRVVSWRTEGQKPKGSELQSEWEALQRRRQEGPPSEVQLRRKGTEPVLVEQEGGEKACVGGEEDAVGEEETEGAEKTRYPTKTREGRG